MKTIACIIARTSSTRLPKKVLREVAGLKLIEYIIRKIKKSRNIDEIYLCTSVDKEDKVLLEIAKQNGIKSFAGSRESVINRMIAVAEIENADNIVRITGDNIFTDEIYLDLMIKYHLQNNADYTRTEYLPIGITSEIMDVKALKKCYKQMNPNESQYLLLYMFQPTNFNCLVLIPEKRHNKPTMTFTVDTPSDFTRTKQLTKANPNKLLNLDDILNICEKEKITNVEYKASETVKFPANLEFSFKAFRTEMEMRIKKSRIIHLKPGEYLTELNKQNDV